MILWKTPVYNYILFEHLAHPSLAERLDIRGVLIINVRKGTSAEAAGLRGTRQQGGEMILGDIIVSVNNKPILSYDDLRNEFDKYKIGEVINLGIIRDEKKITIPVKLAEVQ